MEKLPSLVAPFVSAATMQGLIQKALPAFTTGWYNKRFVWGAQKNTLTFSTVIGESRIASNASVVDRDSTSPVRSRQGLKKITGSIPAMKHYRFLKEEDARLILEIREAANPQNRLNGIFTLVFNDIKYVADGIENRLDDFAAQALSKGYVEINEENNPDGKTEGGLVDLGLPDDQRLVSDADWSNPAADIVTDLTEVRAFARGKGFIVQTALIDGSRLTDLIRNESLINLVHGYANPGSNARFAMTLDSINTALAANLLPTFELVDIIQRIEVDGYQLPYNPWDVKNVSFVPAGNLGVIHNARAIEDGLYPANNVTYSKVNRTLISKWNTNEPFREYTKAELNAFPGVEMITQMLIMKTDGQAW